VGRLALWALVALLLIRGFGAIITPPDETNPTAGQTATRNVDDRVAAAAVRVARDYFTDPRAVSHQGTPGKGARKSGPGQKVTQAEVVGARRLDPERTVVTVECELGSGRVLSLAVPIQDSAGTVSVFGAPYLVAGPPTVFTPERGTPLSGPDADEIEKLVIRFIGAYASASGTADLVYFVAPGSQVDPLGGFELTGEPQVAQLDDGESARTVTAAVRLKDQATGTTYPLRYRLELVKRKRWFVAGVQGVIL
jgi:hypothetical protein